MGGGIKRCFCLTSVWRLSRTSRTERHRKTKIGTEIAHVTHDTDTIFKVKRFYQAALLTAALTREAGPA